MPVEIERKFRVADDAWLGLKGQVIGRSRPVYEYPIPVVEAHQILDTLCEEGRVEKYRHRVGPEVTHDVRYYNSSLALAPWSGWAEKAKRESA